MSHWWASSKKDDYSGTSQSNSEFTNSEEYSSPEASISLTKLLSYYEYPHIDNRSVIVNEDSLWCTEYANDIFSYLRRIEGTRKPIMYKSPQISHRPNLVALIKHIAESEGLGRTTVHLAIYLLDVFMDTYKITPAKLNLVTLVCLLIAAKLEECDQNIPKICILNSYSDDEYSRMDFKALERMILNFFKWTLLVPTSATFLEGFAHKASICDDFKYSAKSISSKDSVDENCLKELCTKCNNLVFEFLDLTLNDSRLVHIKPSLLSAACIAASRKTCEISSIWPERLQLLTECTIDMIEEYVEALICLRDSVYRRNIFNIKKSPDSGYMTDSESDSQEDDFPNCSVPLKRRRITRS